MQIESISISNFENLDGSWNFGNVNEIRGQNGAGKSALGRAIGWALTGLDAYGDRRTDHVMRDPRKHTSVVLNLSDGKQVERRKTLHGSTLLLNSAPVELDHYGDPHLVLSSFIPGYFQSLDEKQKRQLFMDLLPPVDMVALFSERTSLDKAAQEAMGIDFTQDPVKLHKRWATTRLNKEKEFQQLKGAEGELILRRTELQRKVNDSAEKQDSPDLDEMEKAGKEMSEQLANMDAKDEACREWDSKNIQNKETMKRYENAQSRAGELKQSISGKASKKERLLKLRAEKDTWTTWKEKQNKYETDKKNRSLADKVHKKFLDSLKKRACPTCHQKITAALADRIFKESNIKLPQPADPGTPPSMTSKINTAIGELENALDQIAVDERELNRIENELEDAPKTEDIGPEPDCADPDKKAALSADLQLHRDEYTAAKAALKATTDSLDSELKSTEGDLDANAKLQQETNTHLERLQAVEDSLHPARGVFADALEKQLKSVLEMLPGWEFELAEITKTTGNARPCFREYLNMDNYRVPLRYCSAGQQLRAGVDMCLALDKLDGGKLGMVFVDNCELLSSHLNLDEGVQEFRCVVTDGKLEVLEPVAE